MSTFVRWLDRIPLGWLVLAALMVNIILLWLSTGSGVRTKERLPVAVRTPAKPAASSTSTVGVSSELGAPLARLQSRANRGWEGFDPVREKQTLEDALAVVENDTDAVRRRWATQALAWGLSQDVKGAAHPGGEAVVSISVRAYTAAGALGDMADRLRLRQASVCALNSMGPLAAGAEATLRSAVKEYGESHEHKLVWCAESALAAIKAGVAPTTIEDPAAIPDALQSANPEEREAALGRLVAAFGSPDPAIRGSAAAALKAVGPSYAGTAPALARIVVAAVGRHDDYMGSNAAQALGRLGSQSQAGSLEGLSAIAEHLVDASNSSLEQTRIQAAYALYSLRLYAQAKRALRQALAKGISDRATRENAEGALTWLESHSDAQLRPSPGVEPRAALAESSPSERSQATTYEAEDGILKGQAKVGNEHGGYSGRGYVDGYGYQGRGASTTLTVGIAAAGSYDVTLRYANATGREMTLSVYVGGTKLVQTRLPPLASWSEWGEKTERLRLPEGQTTIAYLYDVGDSGNVNLDRITISPVIGAR
jgi:hypothetical protein